MPARAVPRTVGDFIYYYYAKLVIAPSAGHAGNYRFIMDRYMRLKSGEIHISDYDREITLAAQQAGVCAFCGIQEPTAPVEVIPQQLGGPVGIHNLVHTCGKCATAKAGKEALRWWCDDLVRDKDEFPRVVAGLFLKLCLEKHTVAFGLQSHCDDIRDLWQPRSK
jgi:hypothetical protein